MNYKKPVFMSFFLLAAAPGAYGGAALSDHNACDLIKSSFRNNIDTIIRLEMANFHLKEDEEYKEKYSIYYDKALSNYDTKALLRAMDSVSANCPF